MSKPNVQLAGGDGPPLGTEIRAGVDVCDLNPMAPKNEAELTFTKFNIEWKFPPLPQLQRACSVDTGLQSIGTWCLWFIQQNHHGSHVLASHEDFLIEAFRIRLNRWPLAEWENRPTKSRYREIVRAFSSREDSSERVKQILRLGLNQPNHPTLNIPYSEAQKPEQTMSEKEANELRTYFPGVPKDAIFCISCASYGHRSNKCPAKICKFCGDESEGHLSLGCRKHKPYQQRPQSGHESPVGDVQILADGKPCTGSPATELGPKPGCAMCGSRIHSLDHCPQIWCTYFPSPDKARKVKELPIFCYCCGEAAHFGADCALNHGEHLSGRQYSVQDDMWSSKYSAVFIDKMSSNLPVITLDATAAMVGSSSQGGGDMASQQPSSSPKKKRSKKDVDCAGQAKKSRKAAPPKTQSQPKKKSKTEPFATPKRPVSEKQPKAQAQLQPHEKKRRKSRRGAARKQGRLTEVRIVSREAHEIVVWSACPVTDATSTEEIIALERGASGSH